MIQPANQPPQAQQTTREEERVLGLSFERVQAMTPKLLQQVTGTVPQELGDGYYVVPITDKNGRRRELTVRLGRSGPDTRIAVRAESYTSARMVFLLVTLGVLTMGVAILFMLPWLQSTMRSEARERELVMHRLFRTFEDAVAEQGVAGNYRIGPGADANAPLEPSEENVESIASSETGGERAARR